MFFNSDISYRDSKGKSAIHVLVANKNPEGLAMVLKNSSKEDLNYRSNDGETPLDICLEQISLSEDKNTECLSILIQQDWAHFLNYLIL